MEMNIIPTLECEDANGAEHSPQTIGQPPLSLRSIALDTLTDRTIIEWSSNLGTYGTGGPGFFGLKLAGVTPEQDSWLVLTIWSAGEWLLLDRHWLEASPKHYQVQTPLYSNFSGQARWDHLTAKLVGSQLMQIVVTDDCSTLLLHSDRLGLQHLEIPQDTTQLPPYGNGQQRYWNTQESQKDAWVVTHQTLWVNNDDA